MDFSPCDMPLPALKMRYFSAGGDIIKVKLVSFFKYLWSNLHKEKTAQSIKIEAVNSIVIFINTNKD